MAGFAGAVLPCDTRLMRVALLGFGLIGGSIARALRDDAGPWTIAAWSPSLGGPQLAKSEGVIDEASGSPADAVSGAELVVLAAPPLACLALIDELGGGSLAGALAADAVVTDVASTKEAIGRRADAAGLRFVGGHPMAGRELAGYGAAAADLFTDRPWVVIPGAHARGDDVKRVEALVAACGGRAIRMSAAEHDAAVAAISHLPLVVAAALVEAVAGVGADPDREDWPAVAGLAASGWQGMTRLARGDEAMGAGIIATNGPAIAGRVRDLRDALEAWLVELERAGGPDPSAVAARLAAARRRLEAAE
jgi:prephenate dehydrogenase